MTHAGNYRGKHTSTLSTEVDTYVVSQRTGNHAGVGLCIMVQYKTKFTNSGLTEAAFCQVTGISLLERGL